ncbi:phage portal protein, partial [Streptomyces sp. C3-3]|uniref:phage portal protein n=1 Tax=Streptomyces sp. C3-3 TaxID=2824901 RepID=UPI001B35CC89
MIGEPIEIDDEFYEFIVKLYRIDPDTGKRKVRRAFLSRAKGRAKSELAGMLVCAEALADVRFDGWDASGEPVGRPVRSPYIRCLATEEGQSGNTYDNVSTMLEFLVEHHGDDFPGIDIGKSAQTSSRIVLHQQRGEITPSTASSAAKDGGKESFAVFDETHLYVLPELRRMHGTVRRNLRKRLAAEPWCLETSTMYEPGQDSVAEATHTYYKAIKEGKVRDADAAGLLFDHRQAPDGTDLADRDQLLAGLKAAYGPAAAWMDLDGIISEIWDPQSAASDSRRYWLNQPVAAEDALLDPAEWSLCASPLRLEDGDDVVLGFDGGKTDDATALIAMRVSDRLVHPLGIWERPDGPVGKNWEVDRKQVSDMVAHAFGRWQVRAFFADVKLWESYIDEWPIYAIEDRVENTGNGKRRVVRIYDDEARYTMVGKVDGTSLEMDGKDAVMRHDLGVCPVVRFINTDDLDGDGVLGEVEPLIDAQDQLNMTTFNLLMAQQYAAFRQRWVTGMAPPMDDAGNPIEPFRSRVDGLFVAEDADTKFGEFGQTDLKGYLDSREATIRHISTLSQVPPYHLLGQMVNLSAEALAAARDGLDRKIDERESLFGEGWEQALRLAGLAAGNKEAWEDTAAQVVWRDTSARSLAQTVDALGKLVTMLGVPPQELWERVPGVTQTDVERWKKAA